MSGFVQLFHASGNIVNLPYTLLLGFVLIYWVTVMIGMFDLSSLDFDLGELDGDSGDLAGSGTAGMFDGFLEYFNLRKIPISIFVSFLALSLWMIGVFANQQLHNSHSLLLGFGVFIANIIISSHVAKLICLPLLPLFKNMNAHMSDNRNLTGSRVIITSSTADPTFGQAEIQEEGSPITLLVRTDGKTLNKGDEAVILQKDLEKDIYTITKLEI